MGAGFACRRQTARPTDAKIRGLVEATDPCGGQRGEVDSVLIVNLADCRRGAGLSPSVSVRFTSLRFAAASEQLRWLAAFAPFRSAA
jgi:hypothetical protein